MRPHAAAPARAVRRRSLAVLAALFAVAVAAAGLVTFTGPSAHAEIERAPVLSLQPLLDPVGRAADAGVDVAAATTADMIAAATPPAPPPPPPVACPVPGAEFIDSWGYPRSGGRSHKGVDMMAPHGLPVLAPVAGTIRPSNSSLGGLGFYLTDEDGNEYFGSHLASLTVHDGWVEAGTQIGTVGSTGNASTPHLHFEVMLAGAGSVNPYPFAAAWCGFTDADPFAQA